MDDHTRRSMRPSVWCPNTNPHPSHWHTVRSEGITFAQGLCPGIAQNSPAKGLEGQDATIAELRAEVEALRVGIRQVNRAANAEGRTRDAAEARTDRAEAKLRGANDDWRTAIAERDKLAGALGKVRELIEGMGGMLPDAIRVILAKIEEPEPFWASRELPEADQ